METLIVHPDNQEQSDALKAVIKEYQIPFEVEEDDYDPEFVAKIQNARMEVKNGETRVINIDDL